jgi:hypothetical protein
VSDYESFIQTKLARPIPTGIAEPGPIPEALFPFQRDLCRVALQRGRCALFTDTGTGKSSVEAVWADRVRMHTQKPTLILTPLAVAAQTVGEAAARGVFARHVRDGSEVCAAAVYVTNYDRLHRFDPSVFGGVVLDESSILKASDGATRRALTEAFAVCPFRLSATATPAPNDWTELGQQCEFLGVRTREEMLAEFFVHDGGTTQDWRLKGHAKAAFWEWVSTWALVLRKPSDLGYDDGAYELPPLNVHEIICELGDEYARKSGVLFVEPATTLSEQRAVRRGSIADRVRACAELVAREPDEPWIIWGELNDECDAVTKAIPGAVQVAGRDDADVKESRMVDFSEGRSRVLVTKSSVAGWGMNWQHCARQVFLGASHSYEGVYQSIRRSWRYGQKRAVEVYFIATDADRAILDNLKRKERDARMLADEGAAHVAALTRAAVKAARNEKTDYRPTTPMRVPSWLRTEAAA